MNDAERREYDAELQARSDHAWKMMQLCDYATLVLALVALIGTLSMIMGE